MRVFINATALDVESGTDVRGAIRAHDPALEARVAAGGALLTDARGIEVPLDAPLTAGSILRVVLRSRRGAARDEAGADADA